MAVSEDEIILRARIRDEMSRGLNNISDETLRLAGYMRTADGRVRQLNGRFTSGRRILALYNGGLRETRRDTVRASGALDRLARNASQATRQILRLTASVLGLSLALRGVKGLFGAIRGIQGETKLLIALFATLIPAAVPVFAVVTAYALSAGSAFTSLAVSLGVLVLAFSGVGEAVSALASGDIDKINEAFANLSTSGQDFARTLFGLKPLLDTLRGTAQEAALPGIQDALLTLTSIMPNVNALVAVFGGALGGVAQQFANAFTSPGFTNFLQFLSDNVGDLSRMADAVITLGGAVGDLFIAFYPLNAFFGEATADAFQKFADFASGASGTLGQFLTYIESALPTVGEFFNLFGGTLLELLEQLGQPGIIVLQALNGILTVIGDLAPTIGALAEAIGVGLLGVTNALIPIIEELGPILGDVLIAAATALADALVALAPHIGVIAEFIGQQLLAAVEALAPFLPILGEAFLGVLDTLLPLLPVVVSLIPLLGNVLVGIFAALTPLIDGVVQALLPFLEELITQLAPILPQITDGLLEVVEAILPMLPAFSDLLLQLLPLLPSLLTLAVSLLPLLASTLRLLAPLVIGMAEGFGIVLAPVISQTVKDIESIVNIIDKLTEAFTNALEPLNNFLQPFKNVLGVVADKGLKDALNFFSGNEGVRRSTGGTFGDTATAHGSGDLGSTLAAHSSLMGGGVAVSNALIGGGGRSFGSGDHQAGRALDLVGPGTGAYAARAKAAGHFAEYHGTGASKHLHVAYRRPMGDTTVSMAPTQAVATSGGTTINFYGPVYGMDDFNRQVSAAVDEKNRLQSARRRNP